MVNNKYPIGIFDSGVGGLSVLKAVREQMPGENIIYLADTGHTPYGGRSIDFIESRVAAIADFLIKQPVKLIVIACNTATAAAVHSLRQDYDIPIVGLEPALKTAIEFTNEEKVGVLATQATLESEKYQQLRSRFIEHAEIIERASPFFVELVETAPVVEDRHVLLVRKELQPFIDAKVDSLVLGCTHFPFLTRIISQILGPHVKLFESATPVAKEVCRQLAGIRNPDTSEGTIEFFSSSPEKAQKAFDLLLGKTVKIKRFNDGL